MPLSVPAQSITDSLPLRRGVHCCCVSLPAVPWLPLPVRANEARRCVGSIQRRVCVCVPQCVRVCVCWPARCDSQLKARVRFENMHDWVARGWVGGARNTSCDSEGASTTASHRRTVPPHAGLCMYHSEPRGGSRRAQITTSRARQGVRSTTHLHTGGTAAYGLPVHTYIATRRTSSPALECGCVECNFMRGCDVVKTTETSAVDVAHRDRCVVLQAIGWRARMPEWHAHTHTRRRTQRLERRLEKARL